MLDQAEARASMKNWKQAMREFQERRQALIDSGKFLYVWTNGYVRTQDGDVVWHTEVSKVNP